MNENSPLSRDEIIFTYRLLFETLHFNEPIEKAAEQGFKGLGLSNGAIENFIRVMHICEDTTLPKIYRGHVPPTGVFCPWKTQADFLQRVSELQNWLKENGGEPCDVKAFVRQTQGDEPE